MARVTITEDMFRNLDFIMQESYYGDKPMTNREKDIYINSIVELACKEYWEQWYKKYSEEVDN